MALKPDCAIDAQGNGYLIDALIEIGNLGTCYVTSVSDTSGAILACQPVSALKYKSAGKRVTRSRL